MDEREQYLPGFCCPLDEIGTGWHPLVLEMCEKLAPHIDENFRIMQIKEKFGALRVTAVGATSEACEIIEDYEQRSTHICEFCGAPGSRNALRLVENRVRQMRRKHMENDRTQT